MIKDEYSPYKIIHHLDKIQQLKEDKQTNPLQIQIIPSNKCNQKCSFCAYRLKDYLSNELFDDKLMLSYEKIIETIDCLKEMNINAVQYTGGGEPLVHPRIYDIFKYTLNNNIELALVSNGMALNENLCDLLGDSSWVRISMDSCTPNMYSFLRQVSKNMFEKTINNIKTLVKYKRKNTIGVGFVVEKENYKEIYEAAKMFKEIGVDNFRISAAFTPFGYEYFTDFMNEAKELSSKAAELSDCNFTVFNLFNDRVKDNFEGVQDYSKCYIKDLLTYIAGDYNVYTCCTLAYNKKGLIGSIKDQSFKDLWESSVKTNFFDKHNPSCICRNPCMYKNKNEFIKYLVKKHPKHINFI